MKVQTGDSEIEYLLITFDIVVVEFNDSGQPKSKEVFGQKFAGTKEDFQKQFNE